MRIELARAAGSVEIRVSDTGQGFVRRSQPYLFDRFRQADASITPQVEAAWGWGSRSSSSSSSCTAAR